MEQFSADVEIEVPNQTRYLGLVGRIGEELGRELERGSDPPALAQHVNLALTEALANAIEHAHAGDPSKTVRVLIKASAERLLIQVYDQGQGFDIQSIPPPDTEQERGRGIFIIRSLMDSVSYRKTKHGNVLEMVKRLT